MSDASGILDLRVPRGKCSMHKMLSAISVEIRTSVRIGNSLVEERVK